MGSSMANLIIAIAIVGSTLLTVAGFFFLASKDEEETPAVVSWAGTAGTFMLALAVVYVLKTWAQQ